MSSNPDFFIVLDNPSMSYFPGEMVAGQVVLRTKSFMKTNGLQLKFSGNVFVHWTEETRETIGYGDERRTQITVKSFGDSQRIFDFNYDLLGDEKNIYPGESSYQFCFQIPSTTLPSSYVGQHGRVEYLLSGHVKGYSTDGYNTKRTITVNSIVDLNHDPIAVQQGMWRNSKTFCCFCCASGPLDMNIRLPSKGYCPGENMMLEVEINNLSTEAVIDVSVALIQQATFNAIGSKRQTSKTLITAKRGEGVERGDSDIWRHALQVPSVPPTKLGGCKIIDVQYVLKVEAHVSGVGFNLTKYCPIIIGTIPVGGRFDQLRATATLSSAPPPYTPGPSGYHNLPQVHYNNANASNLKLDSAPPNNLAQAQSGHVTFGGKLTPPHTAKPEVGWKG